MNIGKLSRLTDVKVDTIRYYERIGLIPTPARTSGNQRVYASEHLRRLSFVKRARGLGFTLEEVRELIQLGQHADQSCAEVHAVARRHLDDVDAKLAHLQKLRAELADLAYQCVGGRIDHCGILDALGQPTQPPEPNDGPG